MGLVSNGGVHSHINHIYAIMELANQHNVPAILHIFGDGRDVPPTQLLADLDQLIKKQKQLKLRSVRSLVGSMPWIVTKDGIELI